ncbi:MAG: hypothetical protein KQH83_04900 [Actinobacteria bacterium]|nr:hypothetical protein [Actinomycetota bacterium]
MRRLATVALTGVLLFAACGDDAPAATASTTTAPTGAAPTTTDPVYVAHVEFVFLESYPVQVRAVVTGDLPTPCHEPGWTVGAAGADGRVVVDMWSSVPDPDLACAQVLEPFEVTIDVGSFETGDYVVEIGGTDYPFTI